MKPLAIASILRLRLRLFTKAEEALNVFFLRPQQIQFKFCKAIRRRRWQLG